MPQVEAVPQKERTVSTDSPLAISIGKDRKGLTSVTVYTIAIPLALFRPWIARACYVLVAVMWLIPDRRIEKNIHK